MGVVGGPKNSDFLGESRAREISFLWNRAVDGSGALTCPVSPPLVSFSVTGDWIGLAPCPSHVTARTFNTMNRFLPLALLLVCISALAFGQAAPRFQGKNLPLPPQQTQPWTVPETKLPPLASKAIADLFKDGLADPRGCEYREIEVETGSCWHGYGAVVKTAGWVLPGEGKQKFAVCWDGLVYPVVSIGQGADLDQEVRDLLKNDKERIETKKGYPYRREINAGSRGVIGCAQLDLLKAALLLRLGKTALAEQIWAQYFLLPEDKPGEDPYLRLARGWAFSLFERAICAHMSGEDPLALASAEALVSIQEAVEREAAARGLPRPTSWRDQSKALPYLSFLGRLPDLVADQRRRSKQAPYTPVLQMNPQPQGTERVAGLIRDLELVSARQDSQPGCVSLDDDPIVKALIQEGPAAVEPLLDCVEKDTRLTRSVGFGRDFRPDRTVLSVYRAARVALADIMKTSQFQDSEREVSYEDMEGRKRLAAEIRSYWQKNKGVPLVERWYQKLADDNDSPEEWLEAATNLSEPVDVERGYGSSYGGGWRTLSKREPGTVLPLKGESLRAKKNPSVTDLFLRRISSLTERSEGTSRRLEAACKLALAFADWDGKGHFSELHDFCQTLLKREDRSAIPVFPHLVQIFEKRYSLGDKAALEEYLDWLATAPSGLERIEYLSPLWRHMDDPAATRAAEKMFAKEDSKWSSLFKSGHLGNKSKECVRSPLLGLPGFRTGLLRALVDTTVTGTFRTDGGPIGPRFEFHLGWGWDCSFTADPMAPQKRMSEAVRVCDLFAYELSQVDGFPQCQLYWPIEARDKAISACADILRRFGHCYSGTPIFPSPSFEPFELAFANFDKPTFRMAGLDHPASPQEVEQGLAIFSLLGESGQPKEPVRVLKLSSFPANAKWFTQKDAPYGGYEEIEPGKPQKRAILYHNQGTVWQAEEVLVKGTWKRFFGFVGGHHIEKVPASEIEFPLRGWTQCAPGLDCRLVGPQFYPVEGPRTKENKLRFSSPLPVTLEIRNRTGLDQLVPAQWKQPAGDSKHWPEAIRLSIYYSSKSPEEIQGSFWAEKNWAEKNWEKLPLLPGALVPFDQGENQPLRPTETVAAVQVDLRDLAKFDRPGEYRLEIDFPGSAPAGKNRERMRFTLPKE